jgi:hypothetical protein
MATCTVSYTPTVGGFQLITGSYSGDSSHATSTGNFTLNVRSPHAKKTLLTFTGFDLDDYDNGVGQLQVYVNGQFVADIPAGLNNLSGSGDYTPYSDTAVKFGPFDISSFLVDGQNNISFIDPLTGHYGTVRDVSIIQGTTVLLHVYGEAGIYPGHSALYTFSRVPLEITSFTITPASPTENQLATFTVTYAGGTPSFTCIFRFGDGEHAIVTSSSGTCSVTHDYDYPGTFTAIVTVRGASTSDIDSSSLTTTVAGDN